MKTPKTPDPKETAAAQAGMNVDTAQAQQLTNMVDQIGPDGTLKYNQTGSNTFVNSQGQTVTIPKYTATTTLSDAQQAIKNQTDAAELNIGTIANDQSAFLKDYLNKPFTYSNEDAENWAYDLASKRLDPRFAKEEEALRTRFANQGVTEGSAAWNNGFNELSQSKNDAYNNLMLTGRQQAFTEALQQRNQPINEISALLSGAQVSMPQQISTPTANVAGVDYSGLVSDKYKSDMSAYQSKMGGLFGLLGTGVTAGLKYSDRRLKEDIRRVGTLDNGLAVYSYRMAGSPVTEIGLMADEVQQKVPSAVAIDPNGFKMVDYLAATEAA